MKLWKKILVVLIVIFGIQAYIFYRSSEPLFLDKSNPLTIEEVLELHKKLDKVKNIHIVHEEKAPLKNTFEMWFPSGKNMETLSNGGIVNYSNTYKTEIFAKDNRILTISKNMARKGSGDIYESIFYNWKDGNTNEEIYIAFDSRVVMIANEKATDVKWQRNTFVFDFEYDEENDEYTYLGRTKVNGRNTVVVKVYNTQVYTTRIYYIDEETGIIVKEKNKENSDPLMYRTSHTLKFELDTVTDEDVEKIDYKTKYPDFEVVEIS